MSNLPFVHAASAVILVCALFGILANLVALRRFAVSAARPLLGWTIISNFFLCLTLAIGELRDVSFQLASDVSPVSLRWLPELHKWPVITLLAKVSLGASVVFSATMLVGLLWHCTEASIRRAALCSVTWTFIIWLVLSMILQRL